MPKELNKRVAVVTGGTLGIGDAITGHLLDRGWIVHVLARRGSAYKRCDGVRCFGYDVDVTDHAAVHRVARTIRARFELPFVNALVVCAGVGFPRRLEQITTDDYREIVETNVGGTIFSAQAFAPLLMDGQATVMVMSSIAGRRGFAEWSLYCASKHALEGFGASLRYELRPRRIRVTMVQPGSVDTPSYDHLPPEKKTEFMASDTVGAMCVDILELPVQATVEQLFLNNSVGDL